ncbi:MAG: hypothetical protein WDN28_32510 [Chthoniobacter sp.]
MRRRANGGITARIFAAQINRLAEEELHPKGLELVVRERSGGRTRFVVKDAISGEVCEVLDFAVDGAIEAAPGGDQS